MGFSDPNVGAMVGAASCRRVDLDPLASGCALVKDFRTSGDFF